MKKQTDFNVDMEKYLVKKSVAEKPSKSKAAKKKNEQSVTDLYPELNEDDNIKVHVIEKDSKARKLFMEYKKRVLSILRKEEKEIEDMELDEQATESELKEEVEELVEEVEDVVKKDGKETLSFSERFKVAFNKMIGKEKRVEPENFEIDPKTGNIIGEDSESIEEEFEEEIIEEELEENKKVSSWIKRIFEKVGVKQEESIPEELDEESDGYDEKKITKLVLYKPKIEKEMKLALMIAEKYLKKLSSSEKHTFKTSGDQKDFDNALKKLKLK